MIYLAIVFICPKFCQLPVNQWVKVTPFLMNSWTVLDYHIFDQDLWQWVYHCLVIPLRCASYFFQSSAYHDSRQGSISNSSGSQRIRTVSRFISQIVLLSLTSCLCPSRVRPSILGRALYVTSFSSESDRGANLIGEPLRHEVLELTRANQILKAEMSMPKYVATFNLLC